MQQPIAFDTETHLFGPGNKAPRVVCVSAAAHYHAPSLSLAADAVPLILQPLLGAARDGQAIAIGQNVAYDMACLLEQFPSELCNVIWQAYSNYGVHCTKIRERLIDIMRGSRFDEDGRKQYSLDALAKKRLGITLDKDTWRLDYAQFDGVPITQWPQGAQDYATGDATATLGVWESQEAEIARASYPAWHDECARQSAFAFALYLTTCRGVMVDQERVRALKDSLTPRMMQARDVMIANGLLDAKKGSKITKAIRAAIEATWIGEGDIPRTDKTNQVQTALEVVEQCTHPGLAALAEYAGTEKMLSSFVLKLEEAGDKPIHGEYEPLGADTGRTSGRNPNLQQQPRAPGVRECFVARPGFVFVSCDYDSQELRTLAQVLKVTVGHSTLAERYAADPDYDPHTDFAARLVGITYAEAMARKKAKDKALLERRQQSKVCFHPDTEILTRSRGWIRIEELTDSDEVAAAYPRGPNNCTLRWEKPYARTRRKAPGSVLWHLLNKGMDLRVTSDHRMLAFGQDDSPFVTTPAKMNNARSWAGAGSLVGGAMPGGDIDWKYLRLAVAAQADGSYQGRCIRFGFTKKRKIARMRLLLKGAGVIYTEKKRGRVVTFRVKGRDADQIKRLLDPDKTLPLWMAALPLVWREDILQEAACWDSHKHPNGRRFFYSSTIRKNIDVMQAIAAVTGRKSRIRRDANAWILSVGDHAQSRGGSLSAKPKKYKGAVVCLSVPSSFVLVRDRGIPVIVGQCNFGFPGGMGAEKFRVYARGYDLDLTLAQTTELREAWFAQYPEMREYFNMIGNKIDYGDMTFEQLYSGRLRGGCHFTNGCNTLFQGLAADASKSALWEATKRCYGAPGTEGSALFGCRPVVFVHDEIIIEAPEPYAHEAAVELDRVMCAAMQELTPDVPARASPALMRFWSKKADAVFDKNGCYIPWEDTQNAAH